MSKELVISSNRHETKVALIEDDLLCEVYFQRANEYSLAGSIHKGRVTRVLPGMQSAFVDLGLERDTFLYVSDFSDETEDFDRVSVSREPVRGHRPPVEPALVQESVAETVEAVDVAPLAGTATSAETESAVVGSVRLACLKASAVFATFALCGRAGRQARRDRQCGEDSLPATEGRHDGSQNSHSLPRPARKRYAAPRNY